MNNTKGINSISNSFKKYFKFDTYNAVFKKEIIGGITTFMAMAYILAVNPAMVSSALGKDGDLYEGGLFLVTAISAFVATMFMGLYARIPVSLAPGMGLNAFFTYTIASQVGFESALTVTLLSGFLYFLVVMTPARHKISSIMPTNLKLAIGVSIGFFVAYIGLQDSQIIVKGGALVSDLGNFTHPLVIVALVLIMLGFVLHYAKIPGAILITMIIGAIIVLPLITTGVVNPIDGIDSINPAKIGYKGFDSIKDVATAVWKGFSNSSMWSNPITYIGALSFLYMDFFDTTGTLISIEEKLQLNEKDPKWMSKANVVDALGTIFGASIGSTTVTTFVESNVGISAGARTGFSTIITALCFGVSIALWPILQIFMPINFATDVPDVVSSFKPITGPILVLIGTMMITQIKHFEWEIAIDIPTLFITIIFMLLSNSIAAGIAFGTIAFVLLNGSLGVIQQFFKKEKKIVNSMEITTTQHSGPNVKTREFHYLKRINATLIAISIISIAYLILQSGITHAGWFK